MDTEDGKTPESLLKRECLPSYRRERDALLEDIVSMTMRLLFMRKILNFPFHIFSAGQPSGFWEIVYASLVESTVLVMARVGFDTDKKLLTLENFKNRILDMIKQERDRKAFSDECNESDFSKQYEALRKKVAVLRNNFIAHRSRKLISDRSREVLEGFRVTLGELESIRATLKDYFQILCLGHRYGTQLMQYQPEHTLDGEEPDKTDIRVLLDFVAQQSDVLHMPERDPDLWLDHRQENLNDDDIVVFNQYRAKSDLPPVE